MSEHRSHVHPMQRIKRPMIRTRPIQRGAEHINAQIESNEHGTDFYGDGRVGKDWAIRYLFSDLSWTPFPASCFSLLFPKTSQSGDGYFFNSCLLGGNQRFIASAPGNYCQKRMSMFLLGRFQLVAATVCSSFCAGVRKLKVLRGLPFNSRATLSSWR